MSNKIKRVEPVTNTYGYSVSDTVLANELSMLATKVNELVDKINEIVDGINNGTI